MTHKVFVYGTLRPSKVATHKLYGYEMYNYGKFPYIIPYVEEEFTSHPEVLGNLILVDDSMLAGLDLYEGVAKGLYTRETVTVLNMETDERVECFVYVATSMLHPSLIASGDWFNQ